MSIIIDTNIIIITTTIIITIIIIIETTIIIVITLSTLSKSETGCFLLLMHIVGVLGKEKVLIESIAVDRFQSLKDDGTIMVR